LNTIALLILFVFYFFIVKKEDIVFQSPSIQTISQSTIMAATLHAAVLPYNSTFVSSELSTVSLRQDFADGSHAKKQCPVFNGEHGIEALFYVEERFRKLAERNFLWAGDGADLFTNFEEVLVDTALTNWEDIIDPIDAADKSDVRFDAAIQEMYRKYVGAEARDTQLEYFKTLRKPMKSDPLTHSSRMLTLARYGNRLPGTEPPLTDLQVKKCIFHSFPQAWQQQFVRTGQHVATPQLSDIIEFMSNEKSFADAKAPSQDQKEKQVKGNGGDHKKRKGRFADRDKGKFKAKAFSPPAADEICRIHGGHTWGKCFNNPRGTNAKGRGKGGRNGGRGGRGGYQGRGNGGRGNGNGRGNGHYHFDDTPEATAVQGQQEVQAAKKGSQGNPAEQHHFDLVGKMDYGWTPDSDPGN
jgi:hypothetical protein